MTSYDDRGKEEEPIDDLRYGRLVARYDGWGYKDGRERNREIPVHRCSDEELGITRDDEG